MEIIHLTQHYYPFFGGVEKNVQELSEKLVRDGFEVEVVCDREPGTVEREIINGVDVHRVQSFRLATVRYDVGRIAPGMLPKALRNDADVLHAHAYGFFPTFASMFSSLPTVITPNCDPGAIVYPIFDLSRAIPLRLCNYVVATTDLLRQHLIRMGVAAHRIVVIPNGITLPVDVASTQVIDTPNVILCLARLDTANKGQDILLKAMPRILDRLPNAKLWFVGSGRDLHKLRRLAVAAGVSNNVAFTGSVTEQAKSMYFRNASVLCISPRTESFGIVYLEAMAYGLPIVTTNVGGIREVVQDAAVTVPREDPNALADAVIKVMTDRALAGELRARGLDRVKLFDWDSIVKRYETLYEQVSVER